MSYIPRSHRNAIEEETATLRPGMTETRKVPCYGCRNDLPRDTKGVHRGAGFTAGGACPNWSPGMTEERWDAIERALRGDLPLDYAQRFDLIREVLRLRSSTGADERVREAARKQPCGECHLQRGETCNICGAKEGVDDFADIVVRGSAVIRECAKGYGERVPYFAAHDACKRFYRMGWRKVAPPELSTCSRCGAENVVTSQ